jgi:hypothetical protein
MVTKTIESQCSVCGWVLEPKAPFAVVGSNEFLCMSPHEEGIPPCYGWFAGYPYILNDYRREVRKFRTDVIKAQLGQIQALGRDRLRILEYLKDRLAFYNELELIWELQRMRLLP